MLRHRVVVCRRGIGGPNQRLSMEQSGCRIRSGGNKRGRGLLLLLIGDAVQTVVVIYGGRRRWLEGDITA